MGWVCRGPHIPLWADSTVHIRDPLSGESKDQYQVVMDLSGDELDAPLPMIMI